MRQERTCPCATHTKEVSAASQSQLHRLYLSSTYNDQLGSSFEGDTPQRPSCTEGGHFRGLSRLAVTGLRHCQMRVNVSAGSNTCKRAGLRMRLIEILAVFAR
jgi:hypothetical protein